MKARLAASQVFSLAEHPSAIDALSESGSHEVSSTCEFMRNGVDFLCLEDAFLVFLQILLLSLDAKYLLS